MQYEATSNDEKTPGKRTGETRPAMNCRLIATWLRYSVLAMYDAVLSLDTWTSHVIDMFM